MCLDIIAGVSFNIMMMRAVCELVFRRETQIARLAATSLESKGKVCECFLRWCCISLECLKVSHAPIIIRGYDIYGQRNFSIKPATPYEPLRELTVGKRT